MLFFQDICDIFELFEGGNNMENLRRENRIAQALELRNMKQIELSEKTDIPRGTINNWMNQRYQPKATPLAKMAKALDVSELWLAGYDIPMERPMEQVKADKIVELANILRSNDKLLQITSQLSTLTDTQLDYVSNLIEEFSRLNK